jgi:hypothetical protein
MSGTEREAVMYHLIQFATKTLLDLEVCHSDKPVQVVVKKGSRLRARVQPHVLETANGPVEVADLLFEDGYSARQIRFECFSFVDEPM